MLHGEERLPTRANRHLSLDVKCLCDTSLVAERDVICDEIPVETDVPRRGIVGIGGINFFLFYGHGTDTQLIGSIDGEPVVDLRNVHLLRGCVVYALACNTALVLGPAAIEAGGLAYIGYNKHFMFPPATHEVFGECANSVPLQLAEGKTTEEALRVGRQKFDYYIGKYENMYAEAKKGETRQIYKDTFECLAHDKNSLTLLGNRKVTLNYSLLRFYKVPEEHRTCPHCGAIFKIPSLGEYFRCERCNRTVYAYDIFEKLG